MKVDFLFKKPGNSLPRIYKGIKKAKRLCYAVSGAEFAVGMVSAKQKDVLMTGVSGILSCWFLKDGKDFSNMQKMLEPQFKQIVERAKRIKKINKF